MRRTLFGTVLYSALYTWLQANLEKSDTNSSYTRRLQWL